MGIKAKIFGLYLFFFNTPVLWNALGFIHMKVKYVHESSQNQNIS